jgi:hypothetical protein
MLFLSIVIFKYFENSMATYRVLENSASNTNSYEKKILFLNSYCDIKLYFIDKFKLDSKYQKIVTMI